jgi:hypothetical protein
VPLLLGILGVVALVTYVSAASATTTAPAWPPSASYQQMLVNEFAVYGASVQGSPLTTDQLAQLQTSMAAAPAAYAATIGGATPTIAGYQTWVGNMWAAAIQQSGGQAPVASFVSGASTPQLPQQAAA